MSRARPLDPSWLMIFYLANTVAHGKDVCNLCVLIYCKEPTHQMYSSLSKGYLP
jgi:hypothetical protein